MSGTEEKKDPLARLDAMHPHYIRMNTALRWNRWRAIMDEMETEEQKKKFLPRTEVELDSDYKFRIASSEFMGNTEGAIDRLAGAVFGVEPKVEVQEENEAFKKWRTNVDGTGTKLVDFFEDVSREAQGMGIAFVGIDRSTVPTTTPIVNKAQEQLTLRVFLTQYPAEDVRNWDEDANTGEITRVVINRVVEREVGGELKYFRQAREIDLANIAVYEKQVNDRGEDLDEKTHYAILPGWPLAHGLKRIPLVPCYGRRLGNFKGTSMLTGTMKADILGFNEQSWGGVARYRHANPLLTVKSTRPINDIVAGPAFRIMDGEDVKYVETSGGAFEARETAIERLRMEGVRQSGTNPMGVDPSSSGAKAESGIAQRVRFTHTEKRKIDSHSTWIEEGMRKVLSFAFQYFTGREPATPATVSFFSTFETFELDDLLSIYGKSQFWIESPTWHTEMRKAIALKSLPGISESTKALMIKEIEAQKAPPMNPDPHGLLTPGN